MDYSEKTPYAQPAATDVRLVDVVSAIEKRQPVINKVVLMPVQLQQTIASVSGLSEAQADNLSFIVDKSYLAALENTNAGVILTAPEFADNVPEHTQAIVVESPYLAYASVTPLFESPMMVNTAVEGISTSANIHPTAKIHPTVQIASRATIGENCVIGAFCTIGENASLGTNTVLHSHVHVANEVSVGDDCILYPHVVIHHNCMLGHDVRVHAHASIGAEGFGFAPSQDPATQGWERIAQLGRVVIGNHVRIGSQTCIDRGAVNDTIIADNVIIDNLVQVAHNVHIGSGSAIAANTGIAGSTTIGKRCMIGGAVGISGHLDITDDVTLTGMTMVTKSIKQSGSYSSGTGALPSMQWRRAVVRFRNLAKKSNK